MSITGDLPLVSLRSLPRRGDLFWLESQWSLGGLILGEEAGRHCDGGDLKRRRLVSRE